VVFNKTDRLGRDGVRDLMAEEPEGIPVSALRGVGLVNLLRAVSKRLPDPMRRVRLAIPYEDGAVLAQLYAVGRVLKRDGGAEGLVVDAELPETAVGRFRRYLVGGKRPDAAES